MNAGAMWKSGRTGAPPPPLAASQPPQNPASRSGWYTFYLELYQQFGPIVRLPEAQQERVVLCGPEANVFWSQAASDHVRVCDPRSEQNAEYGVDKTIVSSDGPEHLRLRKVSKRGYSRAVLEDRYSEVVELTRRAIQGWEVGQRIPVLAAMTHLFTQQLGCMVLNYAPQGYEDDLRRFLYTVKMVTLAKRRPRSFLHEPVYLYAKARVFELAGQILDAHRECAAGLQHPDLIDDLLAAVADDKDFLSERELQIAVLTPYIGGLEVMASTCTYMLYALLSHLELLERVTAEVDATFAAGGPNAQTFKTMEQLYHTLLETLRMYPVVPLFQGTVRQPFEFAGYQVEAEQPISICSVLPHFLAQIYPDPYRFDIDRYTKARQEHRQPGAFAPYGLGAHSCLGAGQAEVLIMLTIAALLRSVRLELDPADYVPKWNDNNLSVRVLERRHLIDLKTIKTPRHEDCSDLERRHTIDS